MPKRSAPKAALEAAISHAGRERVFSVMVSNGWVPGQEVPIYVWWEAVRIANSETREKRREA